MNRKAEHDQPLTGMRILVVDDEFLIALTIEEALRDAGAEIISAATLAVALEAAHHESLSAAVLDFRLGRQTTEAVADILTTQSIPFVFYSGQALPDRVRDRFFEAKLLIKPVELETLVVYLGEMRRTEGKSGDAPTQTK